MHVYKSNARRVKKRTNNPSPSSFGSEEMSNVIQPSGFSRVTTRTSCRSAGPVPARTHIVEGVYESSSGKQRYMESFWMETFDGNSTVMKWGWGPSELACPCQNRSW
jgi:hypothetical protein